VIPFIISFTAHKVSERLLIIDFYGAFKIFNTLFVLLQIIIAIGYSNMSAPTLRIYFYGFFMPRNAFSLLLVIEVGYANTMKS